MAMPKKGARLIVVDGEAYRWKFSRAGLSDASCGDICNVEIIIELAVNPRSKLITSATGIDEWFGDDYNYNVTPALIAQGIRRARESGWDPNSNGTFLLFEEGPFCRPDPKRLP